MVATRTASLSRCVLRCFGSRFASSALMPSVQTTIPFTWAMARSHVRANTESLHHTQLRPVNSSSQKLMDGEGISDLSVEELHRRLDLVGRRREDAWELYDKALTREAWQAHEFSHATIDGDPWTAVYLSVPENA